MKKVLTLAVLCILVMTGMAQNTTKNMKTVYDFSLKDKKGNEVSLEQYKGKVLLIVNTATGCGFTPQYEDLEAMYHRLKDKGLEILDVPCNQFGHQAPGSDEEIKQFCTLKFGADFPQFKKSDVNGANEPAPLHLAEEPEAMRRRLRA